MIEHNIIEHEAAVEAMLEKQHGMYLSDILDSPPPPWLFSGFMRDHSITMVNAKPYSGKTMLLLAAALSLEYNVPLMGRFAPVYPRNTLFIGGGDAPAWDYGGQARKLMLGYGFSKKQMEMSQIMILPNEGPRITDNSFLEWITQLHSLQPFEVLMIDTLLSVHRADENSAQAMGAVMSILKGIRDKLHCAVIFGHHDAISQQERPDIYAARGSSVIAGAVDYMFSLSRRGTRVKVTAPKGRGAAMEAPINFFDITELDVDGKQGLRLVIPSIETDTILLAHVSKSNGCTRGALVNLLLSEGHLKDKERAYRVVDNFITVHKSRGLITSPIRGVWTCNSSSLASAS